MNCFGGALACYGLGLVGIPGAAEHLRPAGRELPQVAIRRRSDTGERRDIGITERSAVLPLSDGSSWATLDRESGAVDVALSRSYRDEELLHPLLSGSCAVFNWWHGRDAFHAGGFVVGGRAWAVLGEKGDGKSTLLAYLASQGLEVLSDDLVVEQEGDLLPGPAFIDLRPEAARQLGQARDMGMLGARPRFRLEVPKSSRRPLAGWIALGWNEAVGVTSVPVGLRLRKLFANRAVLLQPAVPGRFTYYASLPFFELQRPKRWDQLPGAADTMLDVLAG